jgi:WD40 repeat protein
VFNAETLELHITFGGHGQDVNAAIFLADSKTLASAGNDRKVRFWKVEDAKQTAEANGPGEEVGGLRLLADGRVVAVGSTNRGKIYTSADGKEVGEFELPAEWFTSLAVAPSGLWFAGNQQGDLIEFEAKEGVKPKRNWKAIP